MKRMLWTLVCLCVMKSNAEAQAQLPRPTLERPSISGPLALTLQDAVRLAIENNPTLQVERLRVEQARSRVDQLDGEFSPMFNSSSSIFRKDNIVASRFYPTGLYIDLQKSANLGVEARTRTGGRVNLALNYSDLRTNSNTQTLSPQYSATLVLTFSHALLRDFGRSIAETRLRVAGKGAAIADSNLKVRVSQLIQRVEETYWSLTFLQKDLEGKTRSLESAREFLTQTESLLRAGRVAQVSTLQARAAVAEREQEVITAQTGVDQYKDRLKSLLWLDLGSTDVSPLDQSEPTPVLDAELSLRVALQQRPELQSLQQELEERDLELKFAENQKRPRLDLNGQYGLAGLSGLPNPTCIDPTSVLCIPVGTNVTGSVLAGRTGVRDALLGMLSANPYDNWSLELKLQIPIGNKTAKAQYAEASLRRLETGTNLSAMRDQISMEVRASIRDVQAAQKRIDASRQTVIYLEDQLTGMRQQLEAGLVSSYDVLKVFDEVDRARTTELQAMMDLNVALSRVRLAEASGFQKYNIDMAGTTQHSFDRVSQGN